MAFNPNGTIWLCSVPFDNTYKHQYQFFNKANRDGILLNDYLRDTLTEYVTVREPLRGGGARSKLRAGRNIEEIRAKGINYMIYCNEHHGSRKFFAFITDLIYVNENMTEIEFETDVYQTWFLDCKVKPSFVVREHSATDRIGDNIIAENFKCTDFTYVQCPNQLYDETWGYLIGVNTLPEIAGSDATTAFARGRDHSGIYQGMYFYYLESPNEINSLLDAIEEDVENAVEFIVAIPKFCVSNAEIMPGGDNAKIKGYIKSTSSPHSQTIYYPLVDSEMTFEGYSPRNKKMFTHPFFCLYASNHCDQSVEYKIEHFEFDPANKRFGFKKYADCSPSPSVSYVPLNYAGTEEEPDFAISVTNFPQCAFNSDSYKLWLAKNSVANAVNIASGVASIGAGLVMGAAGGGVGMAMGVSTVASGASEIFSTISNMHSASYMPNRLNQGNQRNNLLTAMKRNDVTFYWQKIKRDIAEAIDSYFTMYGYQTNKLKMPNFNARLKFNYIQTKGINLIGGVPNDDMAKLKQIFDNGITLWRSDTTIGDYSVKNPCIKEL